MKLLRKWLPLFITICMALSISGCAVVVEGLSEGLAETETSKSTPSKETDIETEADNNTASEEILSEENKATDEVLPEENTASDEMLPEDGTYTSKEDVALYLSQYGHLPSNFITKKEAEKLGWEGGSLEPYAPGMCIGGSHFGNYEGLLPEKEGRTYTECDIDTLGAEKRGAKRIVFSNDGLIYYTEDHYESFELLYGEES